MCHFFFPLLLPWRSPCKDKSFDCWLETLSRAPRSLDKVSSAAQSKSCIKKKDIFGNASSYVQLCYLNELCGIIIRLMPVQDWLCGEVKEASPSSEIYPGLNQSSITFTLSETTCTSSAIKNRSRKEIKRTTGKTSYPNPFLLFKIKLCMVCINTALKSVCILYLQIWSAVRLNFSFPCKSFPGSIAD